MKFPFFFLLLFAIFIGASCKDNTSNAPLRPNVLFILVDDLGYHDLGITGSSFHETPNIDQLATESFRFTQGYAASRVCSPSRASIMTGKFTARHGITDWIGAPHGTAWRPLDRHDKLLPAAYSETLSPSETTMAEAFKTHGYTTFFAGKWHLGGEGSYPEDHGFDFNEGGWEKGSPIGGFFSPWNNPKLPNRENGEQLSLRLAQETVDFISKNGDKPFFAFLSFYAVHAPLQTSELKWRKYRDKAQVQQVPGPGFAMERVLPIRIVQDHPVYAGLLEDMDNAVGVVLEALKQKGLEQRTIVVFTSDNGGVASGDAYATSNLPLRGGKGYQWEGGIREPYFIKVPWLPPQGPLQDFPVIGTDFYPTLLDLTNHPLLPDQHVDGISLKPFMQGIMPTSERPLFWHYPHYGNQGGDPSSMVRSGDWKLIHYWEDGHQELYHLRLDPKEQQNVLKDYPKVGKDMAHLLMDWLNGVNARKPMLDDQFDETAAMKRHQDMVNQKWPALEAERLELLSKDFEPSPDWWGSKVTKD